MFRHFPLLVLAATLAAASIPAPAAAYDIVVDGGFESAFLYGWQTFGQSASGGTGGWYPHSGGNGTYSGLPTSPPASGSWQAVADNSGRFAAVLYQDVYVPPTTRATLSFVLWYGNAGGAYANASSLSPSSSNQRVRVDVIDTSLPLLQTSGALRLVYQTGSGSPLAQTPITVTEDLTAYAGQTVRLRFALSATSGSMIMGVDDVKLDVSSFSYSVDLWGLYTAPARWADFDGDGRMEIVQAGGDDISMYWQVWRWSPLFGGTWDFYATLPGLAHGGFAAGDADNDGDLDLGAAGWTATRVHDLVIHRNDGGGVFTPIDHGAGWLEPGTRNGSFDWGDADLDGDLDALITGYKSDFFGEYPASFIGTNYGAYLQTNAGLLPGVAEGQGAWCDINQNAVLDVVLVGNGSSSFHTGSASGTYTSQSTGLPALSSGALAVGDLNNDGVEEMVLSGLEAGVPVTRVYSFDAYYTYSWTPTAASLPGVYESWLSLGDVDHDGWLDLALCGNTGSGRITRIYRNNWDGTFSDLQANLPGVSRGSIELGDFEGDGDLDVLVQGTTGAGRLCRMFLNAPPYPNTPPLDPAQPWWYLSEEHVWFGMYDSGYDAQTPAQALTYNFRMGTSPGAMDLVAPMSRLSDGKRLVTRPGESRLSNGRYIPLRGFGHGSLYASAQCVDQCYVGSPWSAEVSYTPGPVIAQVADVPGDQGGHVRVSLAASPLDTEFREKYVATGYNVWRRVPPGPTIQAIERAAVPLSAEAATARLTGSKDADRAAAPAAARAPRRGDETGAGETTDLPLVEWNGRYFVRSTGPSFANPFPAGTWEIVGSFFAAQQASYTVASTTVADSGASGANDQSFIVSVHTTTPSVWFASLPVTGHSVDNLAPAAPIGLTAAHHTGSGNQLAWQPAPEPDFDAFRVYRGTTPGFTPSPATLVATVTDPAWTDPSFDAPTVYYRVSTLDHAGNESPAVAPGSVTGTPVSGAPLAFALRGASPNPFGAIAHVGFAVPRKTAVRLDVFDTAGRLVRTLADGTFAAGEHVAEWSGEDRGGNRVDAGMYFVRMQAGSFTATRRVTYLR